MLKINFFSLLFLFVLPNIKAQNIVTYTDQLGYFWVFDNGSLQSIEHQQVKNVQTGDDYVIYLDILNQMVLFHKGKKKVLQFSALPNFWLAKRNLLIDWSQGGLKVFDRQGKRNTIALGNMVPYTLGDDMSELSLGRDIPYASGDSIAAFVDYDRFLKAYYKGETNEITREPVTNFSVGDNTVAYTTSSDAFYVYFNGVATQVVNTSPTEYQVGNNFAVYITPYNEFGVFDAGSTIQLDFAKPKSFAAGNNIVAYVTPQGFFKVYENGDEQELSPIPPRSYQIIDNTLIYTDDMGNFNVYYKGKNTVLESYQPTKVAFFEGVVAYTDNYGQLKGFYEGKPVTIAKEVVIDFKVQGRTVLYQASNRDFHVYWNGNTY